jgi:hypothetical protein
MIFYRKSQMMSDRRLLPAIEHFRLPKQKYRPLCLLLLLLPQALDSRRPLVSFVRFFPTWLFVASASWRN